VQALIVRGSRDFGSVPQYLEFVRQVVTRLNAAAASRLAEERHHLRPLPAVRMPDYTVHHPTVRRWSTIRIGGRNYSVPSRLIGHQVEVRQYASLLEVRYGDQVVETMPRLRGDQDVRIDYRHVIWSLVRKPGAFARYRFREELFPSLTFRRAYDRLFVWRAGRADIEYVRILHLAASTLETRVERALAELLDDGRPFDYARVKALAEPDQRPVPQVAIPAPDLGHYDRLLGGAR
jgi:hypothetical protein